MANLYAAVDNLFIGAHSDGGDFTNAKILQNLAQIHCGLMQNSLKKIHNKTPIMPIKKKALKIRQGEKKEKH